MPVGGGELNLIGGLVKSSVKNWTMAVSLVVIGVAVALAGITVGELDDAPGASVGGIVFMVVAAFFAVKIARRKP